MGTAGSFHGGKVARGMKLTTHPNLVPRFRICGAISPLLHYNFMAWYLIKHRQCFAISTENEHILGILFLFVSLHTSSAKGLNRL
jgi:hypothetical protein